MLVSQKRDLAATRRFFTHTLEQRPNPSEVTTDKAATYPRALDELDPTTCHLTQRHATNPLEANHGRRKARPRPMRGLKQRRPAQVISTGHTFVQNLPHGHNELEVDADPSHRPPTAFAELARAI